MFATDAFVATFIEQNRGVVTVVNDSVAHQSRALLPAGTLHILLGITGRHGLWQSYTVAAFDVLLPWCDVHPAHHVRAALHH